MKENKIRTIFFWIILGFVIIIAIINLVIIKNTDFWKISFSSFLSIVIALVISYYFSKVNQDERNQKELYLEIIRNLLIIVNDDHMYKIKDESDVTRFLMNKRYISNELTILERYSPKYGIENDILYLREKIQEYDDLVSNHQTDLQHLSKSEVDIKRPLELIDVKLQEIMLKLYD